MASYIWMATGLVWLARCVERDMDGWMDGWIHTFLWLGGFSSELDGM